MRGSGSCGGKPQERKCNKEMDKFRHKVRRVRNQTAEIRKVNNILLFCGTHQPSDVLI